MNKRKYLFFLLCFLGTTLCWAQKGNLTKSTMKSYKNECKQLKKEGWKAYDNALSLDDVMIKYYQQLEAGGDNVFVVTGMGQDKNINKAYSQAKHRASVALASKKGVSVENHTIMKMSVTANGSTSDTRNISAAQAEQIIRAQKPAASLCRKLEDGDIEINLYYIIRY